MVGDGPQDILCAKAAGCRSVGVEGGIQGARRLIVPSRTSYLRSLASCRFGSELARAALSALNELIRTGARRACKTGRAARRPSSRRARIAPARQPSLAQPMSK